MIRWLNGKNILNQLIEMARKKQDPRVKALSLPKYLMSNFYVYPKTVLLNCTLDQCEITWFRKLNSGEKDTIQDQERLVFQAKTYWYKLHEGLIYKIHDDDVAHQLKINCRPKNGMDVGKDYATVTKDFVELGPKNLPFEKRQQLTQSVLEGPNQFRFITYNILADMYADSNYSREVLFRHCPTYALEFDYRRNLLVKEIVGYNADVICLQEVDKKEFIRSFEPIFKLMSNLSGIFHRKAGSVSEGLAIFWRDDKFKCIDTHSTILRKLVGPMTLESEESQDAKGDEVKEESAEGSSKTPTVHSILDSDQAEECYAEFSHIRKAVEANEKLKKRFLDRHTVIQITLLQSKKSPDNYLIVANTHLYFAPDADHIRLLQASMCIKYLEYVKKIYTKKLINELGVDNPKVSAIFCGDMNSSPDCGLYTLATKGKVGEDLIDWKSNKEEEVKGLTVETNLSFNSAYENIEYTNYTPDFNGCLDYIYYERDGLRCDSIVPLPDHDEVIATGGIPSHQFPSDHLALIANLRFSN